MKPWIKRIALALGALLLVLLAGAAWLLASFDAERTKRLLVDWVQQHRQRTLAIDGPLTLHVFPRLEVGLSGVRLSEHRQPDEFLRVERAALAVQVLPLLRQQLRIDRVELEGVRLRYARDRQGRSNIDDLLAPDKAPSAGTEPGRALDFDIAAVKVRELQLAVADAATPLAGEVRLQRLDTGRLAPGTDTPVSLAATLALKQPAVAGELTLETTARFDPAQAALALRDLALGWQGEAFGVRNMKLRLAGDLQREGGSGTLQAQRLKLDFGAAAGGLQLADSTLGVSSFAWKPQQRALALEGLALQLKGRQANRPLDLALEWPRLQVTGDALQGSPLGGRLSLGGAQPLRAEFRSAAPGGSFEEFRLPGFKATLDSPGEARKARGSLAADLRIQPARQALALEALALRLTLEQPQLQPLAIEAQGQASASAQSATWRLGGQFNGERFSTEGDAGWSGGTPRLRLQGEFAALDLDRLLPAPATSAPAPASAPPAPAGDTPVDLSGLRGLQAQVALKAGRLVARQFDLRGAQLDANLEQGMLRVNRLAGDIWGGHVEAQAFADARAQRVTLRGEARDIQLEPALKALASNDQLEGRGRVVLDIETTGHSVQEMKSRLAGSAAVQLRDGALKGINLARALRNAKAALSLREDAVQQASRTEKTDFSELNASFRIAGGVARNQDLDMKSPLLRLGGEGAIDLGRDRLDYTLRATLVNTSKGQGGAELAALRGLTVPVRLDGPLQAPQWRIVWSGVAASAAETALKNGLEEKLRERLGGAAGAPAGTASQPASPRQDLKEQLKDRLMKELFR